MGAPLERPTTPAKLALALIAAAVLVLAACAPRVTAGAEMGAHDGPSVPPSSEGEGAPRAGRCGEEVVAASEPSSGLLEALAPYATWRVLGAREQGLLLPASSRWGVQAAWTRVMGQLIFSDSLGGYVFTSRGTNPWVIYFESSGEGRNFLRNWQRTLADGSVGLFDAAMFDPGTPNRFGLSRTAHIVEVEVNRGLGARSDLHFVATDVRLLDRTPALPIDPERALDEARRCFDDFVAGSRASLEAALERAGARLEAGPGWEPEREQTLDAIAPTFDPDSRRLRVVFARRVVRTITRRETEMITPNCPPGAPCVPPHEEVIVRTRGYGADLAEELEFDARGTLVRARVHGPVGLAPEALARAGLVRDVERH